WAPSTADVRALLKGASATDRIASTYFSGGSFTIDINLTDSQTHLLALYGLDWDRLQRSETVAVLDATSRAVLDSRSLANFTNGQYLIWNLSGHVQIVITLTAGVTTSLSGLFF